MMGDERSLCPGHQRQPSDVEFRELTLRDANESLISELDKLAQTARDENSKKRIRKELDGFQKLFARFLLEKGPSVDWDKLNSLKEGSVMAYSNLPKEEDHVRIENMLNKLVVLKLNGGLGTSMGCTGTKSLISVRNELTFLDLTVQQIENLNKTYGSNVPLVLMNSFNTEEDTEKTIRKYTGFKVQIHTFNQSRYPRINKESLLPIAKTVEDSEYNGWYPPGHGDIYSSFANAGLLQKFVEEGKEYVFISNIDNLGATIDINILNLLLANKEKPLDFVMEVTDKTRADVKGGTLVEYDGKLRLLEIAQCPKDKVDEFKSISKFKIFNTNNLWINLRSMMEIGNNFEVEIIVNPKTLENGLNVIQLETAVGAGIKNFNNVLGINVPRSRFLPVKTTSDLMTVMSNLYALHSGSLEMNAKRAFPSVPLVKLGTAFKKVKDFLSRFANIPDLLELDHLTVSGDVTFGKNVILKGTVIIIANHGERIDIPSGSVLENKIVSGNLRILDH